MKDLKRMKILTAVFCIISAVWLFSFIPVYQYLCSHPDSYKLVIPGKILRAIDSFDMTIDKIRPESVKSSQAHKDFKPAPYFIATFLTVIPAMSFFFFGWTNLVWFPYLRKIMRK